MQIAQTIIGKTNLKKRYRMNSIPKNIFNLVNLSLKNNLITEHEIKNFVAEEIKFAIAECLQDDANELLEEISKYKEKAFVNVPYVMKSNLGTDVEFLQVWLFCIIFNEVFELLEGKNVK